MRLDRVFAFQIKNRPEDLEALNQQLREALAEPPLPEEAWFAIDLVVDEIVTNIIKYAHGDDGEHPIKVDLRVAGDAVEIAVEDEGRPFNPFDLPPPVTNLPVEERPIGGLGIHLLRHTMDRCDYEKTTHGNRLTFTKKLPS